jgi:ssDNA-binding Zn-finger/Zn-ribbon topoisomerase 1
MKSLTEYNAEVIQRIKEAKAKAHLSGVGCPECGTEMEIPNPDMLLTSNPPKKRVKCPKCGHDGYMIVSNILK